MTFYEVGNNPCHVSSNDPDYFLAFARIQSLCASIFNVFFYLHFLLFTTGLNRMRFYKLHCAFLTWPHNHPPLFLPFVSAVTSSFRLLSIIQSWL